MVPVFSSGLDGAALTIDTQLEGAVGELLAAGEFKGKLAEICLLHARDRSYKRVVLVGLGEADKFEPWMLARYAGTAVRYLGRRNAREIAFALPAQARGFEAAAASFIVEGAISGAFDTTMYQQEPEKRSGADSIEILSEGFDADALRAGVTRGRILGDAVNFARRMAITPANDMTPTQLAEEATRAARDSGVQIEVFEEDRCRREGMGSFLSVAQGSSQPPKFIVMTYAGDPSSKELWRWWARALRSTAAASRLNRRIAWKR